MIMITTQLELKCRILLAGETWNILLGHRPALPVVAGGRLHCHESPSSSARSLQSPLSGRPLAGGGPPAGRAARERSEPLAHSSSSQAGRRGAGRESRSTVTVTPVHHPRAAPAPSANWGQIIGYYWFYPPIIGSYWLLLQLLAIIGYYFFAKSFHIIGYY
jgi:hypothetical protein